MTAPSSSLAPGAATFAPRRVPEPYVRAEIGAFPLTSREAFDVRLTELDPGLGAESWRTENTTNPTFRVWRACERSLVEHASGWSLDRLVSVRDRTWFEQHGSGPRAPGRPSAGRDGSVPLHRYVRHLASAHLALERGAVDVHVDENEGDLDAMLRWRWLQFALPDDLLLSALPIDPPPTSVDHENPLLVRGLLDRGVAEIHLHGGAGVPFDLLWTAGLERLADPSLRPATVVGPDFPIGDTGEEWLRWRLAGAIGRIVLAEFLVGRSGGETFADFVTAEYGAPFQRRPRGDHRERTVLTRSLRPHGRSLLAAAINALVRPDTKLPQFESLQYIYAQMHPFARRAREAPATAEEVWRRCDPIAVRLHLTREGAGERWLVREGFRYLDELDGRERHRRSGGAGASEAGPDALFEKAFWQTMRLRCMCYRHIVERPLTAGLQWFIRFYERIRELSAPLNRLRPESVLKLAGKGKRLASLEMRIGVDDSTTELATKILETLESWRYVLQQEYRGRADAPELGLVVEFIKERDRNKLWFKGRPQAFGAGTHAEPHASARMKAFLSCDMDGRESEITDGAAAETSGERVLSPMESRGRRPCWGAFAKGLRFASFVADGARRAHCVGELLQAIPRALWLVRGVDVASDELGVPTWALVPLYKYVRQEAAYASAMPEACNAPTIRTTAHVGEDYRHLLEGLRRVFEAVFYLLDRRGSRLGHALALGVDPRSWAESVGTILMPKEERLWDLVFEWRLYTRSNLPPDFVAAAPGGRAFRVAVHIEKLASEIFGSDVRATDVADLHHALHRFMLPTADAATGAVDICLADIAVDTGLRRFFGRSRNERVADLLFAYLADRNVFRRGQELLEVAIDTAEVEAMHAVQSALRRAVAGRGIVVEVNPTSNLLIGDLLDLRNHPILRLFPIEPEAGPPPVPIAIGSDDPVTFSTTLVREYGVLFHAARTAGYSLREVQTWLNSVRQMSLDARFTLPWRPNAEEEADGLLEEFRRYLHVPRPG